MWMYLCIVCVCPQWRDASPQTINSIPSRESSMAEYSEIAVLVHACYMTCFEVSLDNLGVDF